MVRRLRRLRVRVRRHHRLAVLRREVEEARAQGRAPPPPGPARTPAGASGTSSCRCRCGCGRCEAVRRPRRRRTQRAAPRRRRTGPRRCRRTARRGPRRATRRRAPPGACARPPRRHDLRLRQHDQVRVVNRHQRGQEQRLCVLEVVVEDVVDVFRREFHKESIQTQPQAVSGAWPVSSGATLHAEGWQLPGGGDAERSRAGTVGVIDSGCSRTHLTFPSRPGHRSARACSRSTFHPRTG